MSMCATQITSHLCCVCHFQIHGCASKIPPVHRGQNFCVKCPPCVIQRPPRFLRGSSDHPPPPPPPPQQMQRRHSLYRKFWTCLKALGVWDNEEYLHRKEGRTVREDKMDIMPDCVIEVHMQHYTNRFLDVAHSR